jgi:hypothetical protein
LEGISREAGPPCARPCHTDRRSTPARASVHVRSGKECHSPRVLKRRVSLRTSVAAHPLDIVSAEEHIIRSSHIREAHDGAEPCQAGGPSESARAARAHSRRVQRCRHSNQSHQLSSQAATTLRGMVGPQRLRVREGVCSCLKGKLLESRLNGLGNR